MSAVQSLHAVQEAACYHSDHNPLFLHIACVALAEALAPISSTSSEARVRYDVQKAEAYQVSSASELQQHFIPLIHSQLDVDLLCEKLEICSKQHHAASVQTAWGTFTCTSALV